MKKIERDYLPATSTSFFGEEVGQNNNGKTNMSKLVAELIRLLKSDLDIYVNKIDDMFSLRLCDGQTKRYIKFYYEYDSLYSEDTSIGTINFWQSLKLKKAFYDHISNKIKKDQDREARKVLEIMIAINEKDE